MRSRILALVPDGIPAQPQGELALSCLGAICGLLGWCPRS